MAATLADLKAYVGASDTDDAFLQQCLDQADALIAAYLGATVVPVVIRDRCHLEVGAEMFNRRNSPSGSSQFVAFEGGTSPVRGPRDPMTMVYAMLGRWKVPF